jgi:hypothetical protein
MIRKYIANFGFKIKASFVPTSTLLPLTVHLVKVLTLLKKCVSRQHGVLKSPQQSLDPRLSIRFYAKEDLDPRPNMVEAVMIHDISQNFVILSSNR